MKGWDMEVKQEESYKKKKRNYGNANYYTEIFKNFDETDWIRIEKDQYWRKIWFLPDDIWTRSQEVRSILSSKRKR